MFDAMSEMLKQSNQTAVKAAGQLSHIFMNANQLPILGLADQKLELGPEKAAELKTMAASPVAQESDSLNRFLALRPPQAKARTDGQPGLMVVAFTDPNDLLSYRLMPSRYPTSEVAFGDVLVSNATTYFGLLSRPDHAHLRYMPNRDVAKVISCGKPKSSLCR